jgi:TrmH family RNA methyltransferase
MLSRCDVCLVGTANPENLGSVARLADNFAVPALTLVAPRVPPADPRALVVGRAARDRLATARLVATLDDAVAGCSYVVGFSARRGADRPMVGLRGLHARLDEHASAGRIGLVFGPEDNGLVGADLDRCDLVSVIELPGPLASLNLAQAVALVLWELSRPPETAEPARGGGATRAELDALVEHALGALDATGHHRSAEERARHRVHLRRILAAAGLGSGDVRSLRGILAQLVAHTR